MPDRNLYPSVTDVGLHYSVLTDEGMLFRAPISNLVDRKVPTRINPFITDGTTQKYPLGTELFYADRKFRYAKNGAGTPGPGKLMQSVVPLAGHIDEVIAAAAAGDTTITFTPNTVTTDNLAKDELADGYIHINSGTGLGNMYRIKSHPAIVGGVAGVLTLYDPIVVATPASAKATVLHNPWRAFIIHPSPATAPVLGVTVCVWAANEFGWLQYQGPCAVLGDTGTALVIGNAVTASDNVDGAVMGNIDFNLRHPIGIVMAINANTEYYPIWLSIP